MNNRQKQVNQYMLKSEKLVLEELTKAYQKALQDINVKIADLLGRNDIENLKTIIYQVQYQRALKKQISAYLDILHGELVETISDYLIRCYEDGWIGNLFDLQGQNIPLLIGINQEHVIKAINTNSKLSKSLYDSIDIDDLKKTIQSELSRGISQSYTYSQIAKNIDNASKISLSNAMRIARTEGHRITQESIYNNQTEAKKRGCEIKRQWDSTLDKFTRPHHQRLDGQIVGVDEPFVIESTGDTAMYPGDFGVAHEDINCRCTVVQVAQWELDNPSEFTKYDGDAREIQNFKSIEDYEKFKAEFWKWGEVVND